MSPIRNRKSQIVLPYLKPQFYRKIVAVFSALIMISVAIIMAEPYKGEGTPPEDDDNDGLTNIQEDVNWNQVVDPGETDPNSEDTDGDGLFDGYSDLNENGIWDSGEPGEDVNGNGEVDPGETDPLEMDTDGDNLNDGDEATEYYELSLFPRYFEPTPVYPNDIFMIDVEYYNQFDHYIKIIGQFYAIVDDFNLQDPDPLQTSEEYLEEVITPAFGKDIKVIVLDSNEVEIPGTQSIIIDYSMDGIPPYMGGYQLTEAYGYYTIIYTFEAPDPDLHDHMEVHVSNIEEAGEEDEFHFIDVIMEDFGLFSKGLAVDQNSDGLPDGPTNKDSDNDGLDDGYEVKNGLNPMYTDTDLDGYSDYDEVIRSDSLNRGPDFTFLIDDNVPNPPGNINDEDYLTYWESDDQNGFPVPIHIHPTINDNLMNINRIKLIYNSVDDIPDASEDYELIVGRDSYIYDQELGYVEVIDWTDGSGNDNEISYTVYQSALIEGGTRYLHELVIDPLIFDHLRIDVIDTNLGVATTIKVYEIELFESRALEPTKPDTDGDGLYDGWDDTNRNGQWDVGEDHGELGWLDPYDDKKYGNTFNDLNGNNEWDEGEPDTDVLDPDTDDDGLYDGFKDKNRNGKYDSSSEIGEEVNLNGKHDPTESDPFVIDTDGDSIPDGWESGHGLLAHDASDADDDTSDNDGLYNALEYILGTNPNVNDKDGDTLLDGEEILNVIARTNIDLGATEYTYFNNAGEDDWFYYDPIYDSNSGDMYLWEMTEANAEGGQSNWFDPSTGAVTGHFIPNVASPKMEYVCSIQDGSEVYRYHDSTFDAIIVWQEQSKNSEFIFQNRGLNGDDWETVDDFKIDLILYNENDDELFNTNDFNIDNLPSSYLEIGKVDDGQGGSRLSEFIQYFSVDRDTKSFSFDFDIDFINGQGFPIIVDLKSFTDFDPSSDTILTTSEVISDPMIGLNRVSFENEEEIEMSAGLLYGFHIRPVGPIGQLSIGDTIGIAGFEHDHFLTGSYTRFDIDDQYTPEQYQISQDVVVDPMFHGREIYYGTDPLVKDTDGDTIDDGDEYEWNSDTLDNDGFVNALDLDSDGDGITDEVEYFWIDSSKRFDGGVLNAGPEVSLDYDQDGISDYIELMNAEGPEDDVYNTDGEDEIDPLDDDSDNDGILDIYEDLNGNGILDEGETSPTQTDSDADRIPDVWTEGWWYSPSQGWYLENDYNINPFYEPVTPIMQPWEGETAYDKYNTPNGYFNPDWVITDAAKSDSDNDGIFDGDEIRPGVWWFENILPYNNEDQDTIAATTYEIDIDTSASGDISLIMFAIAKSTNGRNVQIGHESGIGIDFGQVTVNSEEYSLYKFPNRYVTSNSFTIAFDAELSPDLTIANLIIIYVPTPGQNDPEPYSVETGIYTSPTGSEINNIEFEHAKDEKVWIKHVDLHDETIDKQFIEAKIQLSGEIVDQFYEEQKSILGISDDCLNGPCSHTTSSEIRERTHSIYSDEVGMIHVVYQEYIRDGETDTYKVKYQQPYSYFDVTLDTDAHHIANPSVVVSESGVVHIAWTGVDESSLVLRYATNTERGGTGYWSFADISTSCSTNEDGCFFPDIAIDSSGNPHVVAVANDLTYVTHHYWDGSTWQNGDDIPITRTSDFQIRYPKIDIDNNDDIHVIWQLTTLDASSDPDEMFIEYSKKYTNSDTTQSWLSEPEVITTNLIGSSTDNIWADLAVDSYDGESGLETIVNVAFSDKANDKLRIFKGHQYVDPTSEIKYRVGTWSSKSGGLTVTSGASVDYPSIDVDRAGDLYVSWIDNDGEWKNKFAKLIYERSVVPDSQGAHTFGYGTNPIIRTLYTTSEELLSSDLSVSTVDGLFASWLFHDGGNDENIIRYSRDPGRSDPGVGFTDKFPTRAFFVVEKDDIEPYLFYDPKDFGTLDFKAWFYNGKGGDISTTQDMFTFNEWTLDFSTTLNNYHRTTYTDTTISYPPNIDDESPLWFYSYSTGRIDFEDTIFRLGPKISHPNSADTDQDGVDDYTELFVNNTLTLCADTDHDGIIDGEEIYGYNEYVQKSLTESFTVTDVESNPRKLVTTERSEFVIDIKPGDLVKLSGDENNVWAEVDQTSIVGDDTIQLLEDYEGSSTGTSDTLELIQLPVYDLYPDTGIILDGPNDPLWDFSNDATTGTGKAETGAEFYDIQSGDLVRIHEYYSEMTEKKNVWIEVESVSVDLSNPGQPITTLHFNELYKGNGLGNYASIRYIPLSRLIQPDPLKPDTDNDATHSQKKMLSGAVYVVEDVNEDYNIVRGLGTNFLSEVKVEDYFKIDDDSATRAFVTSIQSDNQLILNEAPFGTTTPNENMEYQAFTVPYISNDISIGNAASITNDVEIEQGQPLTCKVLNQYGTWLNSVSPGDLFKVQSDGDDCWTMIRTVKGNGEFVLVNNYPCTTGTNYQVEIRESIWSIQDHDGSERVKGLNPTTVDSDGDGLPDTWEMYFFGDLYEDGTGDPDSDYLINSLEYLMGTNPANHDTDGGGLPDGYEAEFPEYLSPLNPADDDTDSDEDGLTNLFEYQTAYNLEYYYDPAFYVNIEGVDFYTDMFIWDSDNDGLSDGEEYNGIDIIKDDRYPGDFVSVSYSSDPTSDTRLNPLIADSDRDELLDGDEAYGWFVSTYNQTGVVLDEYRVQSDPTTYDDDGDSLSDSFECWELGADPWRTDTDGDQLTDNNEWIFAEMEKPLSGKSTLSSTDNKLITGNENTKFGQELAPGDLILFEGDSQNSWTKIEEIIITPEIPEVQDEIQEIRLSAPYIGGHPAGAPGKLRKISASYEQELEGDFELLEVAGDYIAIQILNPELYPDMFNDNINVNDNTFEAGDLVTYVGNEENSWTKIESIINGIISLNVPYEGTYDPENPKLKLISEETLWYPSLVIENEQPRSKHPDGVEAYPTEKMKLITEKVDIDIGWSGITADVEISVQASIEDNCGIQSVTAELKDRDITVNMYRPDLVNQPNFWVTEDNIHIDYWKDFMWDYTVVLHIEDVNGNTVEVVQMGGFKVAVSQFFLSLMAMFSPHIAGYVAGFVKAFGKGLWEDLTLIFHLKELYEGLKGIGKLFEMSLGQLIDVMKQGFIADAKANNPFFDDPEDEEDNYDTYIGAYIAGRVSGAIVYLIVSSMINAGGKIFSMLKEVKVAFEAVSGALLFAKKAGTASNAAVKSLGTAAKAAEKAGKQMTLVQKAKFLTKMKKASKVKGVDPHHLSKVVDDLIAQGKHVDDLDPSKMANLAKLRKLDAGRKACARGGCMDAMELYTKYEKSLGDLPKKAKDLAKREQDLKRFVNVVENLHYSKAFSDDVLCAFGKNLDTLLSKNTQGLNKFFRDMHGQMFSKKPWVYTKLGSGVRTANLKRYMANFDEATQLAVKYADDAVEIQMEAGWILGKKNGIIYGFMAKFKRGPTDIDIVLKNADGTATHLRNVYKPGMYAHAGGSKHIDNLINGIKSKIRKDNKIYNSVKQADEAFDNPPATQTIVDATSDVFKESVKDNRDQLSDLIDSIIKHQNGGYADNVDDIIIKIDGSAFNYGDEILAVTISQQGPGDWIASTPQLL